MATLDELRLAQDGIVHLDQLMELGVTRATLRWRLEAGRWQQVLPWVYATFTGALSHRQRLIAAQLYSGPDSQVTGTAALSIYGVRYLPDDKPIRVLIPHTYKRRSRDFVKIHRTVRMDPHARPRGPLRLTSPARSVMEAGRHCRSQRQLRALVAEVVQRGFCTLAHLVEELAAAPRRGQAALRAAIEEVGGGARSAPEAEARALFATSKVLPVIRWNPTLVGPDRANLPAPDGWLEDVGIALEIDSCEHHASLDGWERTLARHAVFAQYNVLVVHFTPRQIRGQPHTSLRTLERAYAERKRAGTRGALRAIPCSWPSPGCSNNQGKATSASPGTKG